MLDPSQAISWQEAPMSSAAVPLRGGDGLRLGRPWKWAVRTGEEPGIKVFLAFDSRKQEFRVWQFRDEGSAWTPLLRVEYHGHAPGWHAHSASRNTSALTAPRRDVAAAHFPLLQNARLWAESANDRLRALFPFEPISNHRLSQISDILSDLSPETAVRAVPFGAGIGLPVQAPHGDSLGLYLAQLGRRSPLYRLEDDGTTVPVLQAAGSITFSERFDFRTILDPAQTRDFYFGPDNRALFTPFFPLDELLDRTNLFVSVLRNLWEHLNSGSVAANRPSEAEAASPAAL